jgi:hypothetical protein
MNASSIIFLHVIGYFLYVAPLKPSHLSDKFPFLFISSLNAQIQEYLTMLQICMPSKNIYGAGEDCIQCVKRQQG